jgi:hypothetical protein
LQVKFIGAFFIIAIIVTISCGVVTGNRISHITMVTMLGSLIFATFGFLIYLLLERKVPEFLEFLSEIGGGGIGLGSGNTDEYGSSNSSDSGDIKLTSSSSDSMSMSEGGGHTEKVKDGKYGDHIIINNITFKNEPKLMAEAVRTIMAQDDTTTETKK